MVRAERFRCCAAGNCLQNRGVDLQKTALLEKTPGFADYGNVDHTFFAGSGGDEVYMRESLRTHTASVGLAYKFGAGAAPMADFPVKARLYKAPPAAPTAC